MKEALAFRAGAATLLVIISAIATPSRAAFGSTSGGQSNPVPPPAPASTGLSELNNGQLQAGAGGQLIEPIPPPTIAPSRPDPGPATTVTSNAPPPVPPGCPSGFAYIPPSGNLTIYPTFTRNASGGYDGHDADYGYDVANAIPPGGDPGQNATGAPATANNIAGHVIAVDLSVVGPTWLTPGSGRVPAVPLSGTCDNDTVSYGFSAPFLDGDQPPPSPPANVLDAPPFGLGADLAAHVMGHWRVGTVGTLPGPDPNTRTFVHIPTCAWLDSGVPSSPTQLHAVKTAINQGYTFFLIYTVDITPGTVTWDWGDGAQTTSAETPTTAPSTIPVYDPTAQSWSDPCTVSHRYSTVSEGRTITAQQSFTTTISVAWSDGVSAHTRPVSCDAANPGPCTATIGPAQGWQSGPHPVDQIEPVPFYPTAGA